MSVHLKVSVFRRGFCLCAAVLATSLSPGVLAFGQLREGPASSGASFERLRTEQKKLVLSWMAEYQKITGRQLDVSTYDSLPLSTRTTFDAVTHALLSTKLTGPKGAPLGTALDLIELVEGVHGHVPDARGDHQFRVYVKLKPDALSRLYRSREFRRTGDNTIYHIGYPINFRQQGGAPSIQFSVTRTGRRADIDVDYRSSSGPQALVNGHLTAANSDVRAGGNPVKHSSRWNGFEDWWRDMLGLFKPAPAESTILALDTTVPASPRIKDSAPVEEAVADFYQTWMVEGKPEMAMSYLSIRSYACLAEYQTGENIESGLAGLRIVQHLRQGLAAYGKSSTLTEVIEAAPSHAPGARPVGHVQNSSFTVEHVADDVAQSMDCRVRLRTNLAEELPKVSHSYGDSYVATVRLLKEKSPATFLTQVWKKEEGYWKIVSWHFENPHRAVEAPMLTARESAPPSHDQRPMPPGALPDQVEKFHRLWLVERDYDRTAAFFSPAASRCEDVHNAGSEKAFLASVGGLLPRKTQLAELISTVEHGHDQMLELAHPNSAAFLLARVSDDLAAMSECRARAPGRKAGAGTPSFRNNRFQTVFRLKDSEGVAGAVQLQWALDKTGWVVTSAQIVSR